MSAQPGCFEWKNTAPYSLKIIQDEVTECSSEITLQVQEGAKNELIEIFAFEKDIHSTLKCEAKIETISRIEIVTKNRVILKGEFETLSLIAFDHKDNGFSTLEGIEFFWTIDGKGGQIDIVDFIDAKIEASKIR